MRNRERVTQETTGGRGEEGVVTSLRWQTDISVLLLDIISRGTVIESLDIGYQQAISLEPSTAEWAGC